MTIEAELSILIGAMFISFIFGFICRHWWENWMEKVRKKAYDDYWNNPPTRGD
jgi:hypothetical protein